MNRIKELSKTEMKQIFSCNSILGYGLYNKNKLIQAISFTKPTRKDYQYEIGEVYCKNAKGFKELFNYFIKHKKVRSCIIKFYTGGLKSLGFKKLNGFYSYFPFGVVFRIDDLDDGSFYIGETTSKDNWDKGYLGTGSNKWKNHLKKHPNIEDYPNNKKAHKYKRTVLYSKCDTPKDLYILERDEIRKYCICKDKNRDIWNVVDNKCMNIYSGLQGGQPDIIKKDKTCKECGGKRGHHKDGCSKRKEISPCSKCGGKNGHHFKECNDYKKKEKCPKCGGTIGKHKSWCDNYDKNKICDECGGLIGHHKEGCSKVIKCPKCGCLDGRHKKECDDYKKTPCPDCGSLGRHKRECPNNKENKECPKCGGKNGSHKSGCEDGRNLTPCDECGCLIGHKKSCSKVYVCPDCGKKGTGPHKPECPKYKRPKICPKCKGKAGKHKKECPDYKYKKK